MSAWLIVAAAIGGLIVGIGVLFALIQQIRGLPEAVSAYWETLTDIWAGTREGVARRRARRAARPKDDG